MFGKPISNQTKLPDNFPLGFSVIRNSRVRKILEIQITLISDEGSRAERCSCCQSLWRFQIFILHRRRWSSTACVAYRMDFPILSSIRVHFVQRANKAPFALHRLRRHYRLIYHCVYQMKSTTSYNSPKTTKDTHRSLEAQVLHFHRAIGNFAIF